MCTSNCSYPLKKCCIWLVLAGGVWTTGTVDGIAEDKQQRRNRLSSYLLKEEQFSKRRQRERNLTWGWNAVETSGRLLALPARLLGKGSVRKQKMEKLNVLSHQTEQKRVWSNPSRCCIVPSKVRAPRFLNNIHIWRTLNGNILTTNCITWRRTRKL